MVRVLAGLSLAAALLVFAAGAQADYKACNETSYVLDAALGASDDDKRIITRGWTRLYPGACADLLEGRIKKGVYYLYARSITAHHGRPEIFGGDELLCIAPEEDFILKEHVFCRGAGGNARGNTGGGAEENAGEKAGFAAVEVDAASWQTIFSERASFSSRRHAIVAGIQRLLKDNGYAIGQIDGYAGQVTLRAVKSFQGRHDLPATGIISDTLFAKLIEGAKAREETAGLRLCNETRHRVWAAVGYRTRGPDPEYESLGWLKIASGECKIAVREELEQATYYAYAEAVDVGGRPVRRGDGRLMLWGGAFAMCVTRTSFRIRGQGNCRSRGYREVLFREIETGQTRRFTETLRE